jgi:hypothetical protein
LKCYNYFNKQKALGYKTPVDMIKYWNKRKKELFKENITMSSYNLVQPDSDIVVAQEEKFR